MTHPPPLLRRLAWLTCAASLAALVAVGSAPYAEATESRSFTLDDAESLAAGELDGTAVFSTGEVHAGLESARLELGGEAVAYAVAHAPDGTVYVGTGDEGRVYRLRGDALEVFAETGQLLVTSLAVAPSGTVYAGTLPEGKIFSITPEGEMREFARPEGAEHVWALAYDARRRTLFAGTGPEGKVFAIDRGGEASVYYDSRAGHVLSLALDADGALYAGTGDDALVLRLLGPGRATVVHDFPGNEIRALAVRDGTLAVVADDMPAPAPAIGSAHSNKAASPSRRRRTGKGKLFRVDADGRTELLYRDDSAHFTAVELTETGRIHVGVGKDGRVVSVEPDGSYATVLDLDERQVLGVSLGGSDPVVVTGDSAAIYRVRSGPPRRAVWTSKVLDAGFRARFGQLSWRASGRLAFATRSGNTEEPDDTWSDWSAPMTTPGVVHSAGARFVQVRASFAQDPSAVLRAVELFYLPRNQRARITQVAAGRQHATKSAPNRPSTRYDLSWSVENPDSDALRYRLRYRREDQRRYRPILREDEVLTRTSYAWQTEGLPDGWYVLEVTASDELTNPPEDALRDTRESEPFRVDNHAPRILDLRARGGRLTGRVVDALGPIAHLDLAIDGEEFAPLTSEDGILDQAEERVAVDLRPRLADRPPGEHILAIRAKDAAGNSVVAEISVTLGGGGSRQ